jgi:uncharacterized DUF497 family protein
MTLRKLKIDFLIIKVIQCITNRRLYLRLKGFEWDDGNVLHIELGHGIMPEEAEEVFVAKPFFRKTKKGHYVAMEPTLEYRYLTIVFELKKNGIVRVITGWDMNRTEKRYWHNHIR